MVQYNFPTKGNVYEYCANEIMRYDRKLKLQRKRELAERLKIRDSLASIGKGPQAATTAKGKLREQRRMLEL